jgi:hypothetical protein
VRSAKNLGRLECVLTQIDVDQLPPGIAREREHLLGQLGNAARTRLDLLDVSASRRSLGQSSKRHRRVPEDRDELVREVVRHPTGEHVQGLGTTPLRELALELATSHVVRPVLDL